MVKLYVLEYLKRELDGTLPVGATTDFLYPTAISTMLKFKIVEIDSGYAKVQLDADPLLHGNQQGTVHGGMLCELADAAIGTAHSTVMAEGETFTSLDLRINFLRPVWKSVLTATARPVHNGRTITHYNCEISRDDGKPVAIVMSTIMTLRDDAAQGR